MKRDEKQRHISPYHPLNMGGQPQEFAMRPSPYDLFGEIPVTLPEIDEWVRVIAKLEPGTPRAEYYIKGWNVPDKIRAAKLRGNFEELMQPPAPGWRRPG